MMDEIIKRDSVNIGTDSIGKSYSVASFGSKFKECYNKMAIVAEEKSVIPAPLTRYYSLDFDSKFYDIETYMKFFLGDKIFQENMPNSIKDMYPIIKTLYSYLKYKKVDIDVCAFKDKAVKDALEIDINSKTNEINKIRIFIRNRNDTSMQQKRIALYVNLLLKVLLFKDVDIGTSINIFITKSLTSEAEREDSVRVCMLDPEDQNVILYDDKYILATMPCVYDTQKQLKVIHPYELLKKQYLYKQIERGHNR